MDASGNQSSTKAARKIIAGLGNPGERYADTRHNLGFKVVEELARRHKLGWKAGPCEARIAADSRFSLVAPQTYMNRSGYSLRCLRERQDYDPSEDLLVVYDEIQLPLGRLRLRRGGSPAGHRGLESVIENLGTDRIPRLRLGVAIEDGPPPGEDWASFVLAPFSESETEAVQKMVERAADACEAWLNQGVDVAMQTFNG